jgi:hypothetical protein
MLMIWQRNLTWFKALLNLVIGCRLPDHLAARNDFMRRHCTSSYAAAAGINR